MDKDAICSEFFDCIKITVVDNTNSTFTHPKPGNVRFFKDTFKFSYLLELFLKSSANRPSAFYNISNSQIVSKTFLSERIIIKLKGDKVIQLEIKNAEEKKRFETYFNRCLEDVELASDETIFEENMTKKIIKDIGKEFQITNLNEKVYTKRKSSASENIQSEPKAVLSSPANKFMQKSKVTAEQPAVVPLSSTSSIFSKKFYSNTNTTSKYDKENSENIENNPKRVFGFKRRHSETNDENDENLNVMNVQLLQPQSAIAKALTPKRNCFNNNNINQIQNSPGNIKTWNRNNSMNSGKGFSNLGNTCYMNAILQCLLNIDSFSKDLLYNRLQSGVSQKISAISLYNCLCELYRVRECHSTSEISEIQALKEVKNAISKEATRFSGYQQHDAHEFLCQVMDQLKEDADKLKKSTETKSDGDENAVEKTAKSENVKEIATDIATNDMKDKEDVSSVINPVTDNFEFQVTHTIKCTECNETITKKEEFNNLCVELPHLKSHEQQISLQHALDIFFRDENVNFNCEKCANNLVTIKHKYSKLPRILIVYLKRYQFNDGANLVKNECDIEIPQYLTLKWLCDENVELPTKCSVLHPTQSIKEFIAQASTLNNVTKRECLNTSNVSDSNDILPLGPLNENLPAPKSACKSSIQITKLNKKESLDDIIPLDPEFDFVTYKKNSNSERKLDADEDVLEDLVNQYSEKIDTSKTNESVLSVYDRDSFVLKELSEEEQINLAIQMSLNPDAKPDAFKQGNTSLNSTNSNQRQPFKSLNSYSGAANKAPVLKKDPYDTEFINLDGHFDNSDDDDMFSFSEKKKLNTYADRKKTSKSDLHKNESMMFIDDDDDIKIENLADNVKKSASLQDIFNEENDKVSNEEKENSKLENTNKTDDEKDFNFLNYTQEQIDTIRENSINGKEPNSYRIIGIVSHLGTSSSSGHYICDVYNLKSKSWTTFDDSKVEKLNEKEVLEKRTKTGYIFFYMHKY